MPTKPDGKITLAQLTNMFVQFQAEVKTQITHMSGSLDKLAEAQERQTDRLTEVATTITEGMVNRINRLEKLDDKISNDLVPRSEYAILEGYVSKINRLFKWGIGTGVTLTGLIATLLLYIMVD